MSTLLNFARAVAASGYPHLYAVRGFDTPEDCRSWFAGERTLFDELTEWLADEPVHGILVDRRDERGLCFVALEDHVDAVHFTLRWSDHLVPGPH